MARARSAYARYSASLLTRIVPQARVEIALAGPGLVINELRKYPALLLSAASGAWQDFFLRSIKMTFLNKHIFDVLFKGFPVETGETGVKMESATGGGTAPTARKVTSLRISDSSHFRWRSAGAAGLFRTRWLGRLLKAPVQISPQLQGQRWNTL